MEKTRGITNVTVKPFNEVFEFMQKLAFGSFLAAAAAISVVGSAVPASALTIVDANHSTSQFANVGPDTVGDSLLQYFSLDLFKVNETQVRFQINNNVPNGNQTRLDQVWFSDPEGLLQLSNPAPTFSGSGTSFSSANGGLPQGGNISGWVSTFGGRGNGGGGIDRGESLSVLFTLASGKTYQNLFDAINLHTFMVGIHAQSINGVSGTSDTYATIPTPALLPGLLGLGVGIIRKRKKLALESSES